MTRDLRWLTYLLTDLGERPRSPPVMYIDNKAMLALCREQSLEHGTKQIALRCFLARELQQHGQLRLSYVASRANTADVFTKALGSGDLQRFCTSLGLLPVLPHLLSEGLGFEFQCVHFGHPNAGGCQRSTAPATASAATAATTFATAVATSTTAAPACCATMASLRVLAFDHEGRPVQFDTWLVDLQLYLLSDSKDSVSLFDLASGTALAPPATADSATRSQWLTRDAAARLAIRNHLPLAECAHFGQHRTAQALYDAVVARYSSSATAALGRLLLHYLFPELSTFAMVEDLVSHLRTSDARYRATVPAELLDRNQPPIAVAVGAARGTPHPPFFEGCSPSPLAPSYASAAAAEFPGAEDVRAASASAKCRGGRSKSSRGGGGGSGSGGGGSSGGSGGSGGGGNGGSGGGSGGVGGGGGGNGGNGGSGGGGTCGGRNGAQRRGSGGGKRQHLFSLVLPAKALHTFILDSGASHCFFHDSTTLTPLPAPVPVRLADPSGGPVVARSSTVLLCPAVPSSSLSGLHLPSFSTNLVSADAIQDAMVTTTTPGGQRVLICTCTWMGRHLATFTRRPGSSLYTLATEPPQVAASAQVSASGQVPPPCSCRLLSHQTLLWHHRLGHPALPRLRGMHSRLLVSGIPRSLPPLPPSPAPPCLPCIEGRQRAALQSSSFPPTTAPLQTLHMDMWGRARVTGQGRERYFLLVVDDYTRGGEFSSNLLWDFCRGEGILQSFTLLDSPQKNGIAERRIGLVMEVTRTSMIHATAPHFLWPFAVQYAAHQLNLWPRVSMPETSPTLRWTGKVGDASVFRVWGSRAFVRNTSADKLSACAIPCVFLGFVPDVLGWQFYQPTSRRVLPSQDLTFVDSVPFYRLFPYCSAPLPPPPLFLAPGPPPVDPLPPQGPAPSRVSQVDPPPGAVLGEVAVDSIAARGTASGGAEPGGAKPGGAEPGGAEPGDVETGGAEPAGVEPGGAEPEGVEPGGAESGGAESGGAEPQGATLSGATGAGGAGDAGAGGDGVTAGAGGTGGAATAGHGGARTRGTGAAGTSGVGGAGAGDPTEPGAGGAGVSGAGGAGAGGAGAGGAGAGGAGAGGAGAVDPGGTLRPQPYFVPLLQQVLGTLSSTSLTPPLLCPPPDQSQLPLPPASPLPAPSPYTEQSGGLTERLLSPEVPDPESDRACATSPTVSRLLATAVTDPSFESTAASALVAELLDFGAAYRLDYATALVVESASASPPSIEGECALGTDVLEDRQEDFECLAAAVLRFASMLLAPEGDPDAPDIPTPHSYAEAITGPYYSQRQAAMDAKMASWKSTRTYVDEVLPPGANIVDGMWIFRVKRPPGSPPAFKARYVARGFSRRQGVDYFQTFSPTPKMTTLRVLLHVAAQCDYELHSLDFSIAFLQGSLHEEIWLRRPPGFTGSFPAGTQWSLRRPVYGLRQAPREWHDTPRTTLAALGFAPSSADPSLFLRTNTSLPPFYVLVYVDHLVFATADIEALTLVKPELHKRHTCTDLGELRSHLGLQITQDRARRTITLTQSHMVHQVLQCFGFQISSPQPTPLSTSHSLSAPPSDESVEPSVLGGRGPVVLIGHANASWVDESATQRSSRGYTFSLGSRSVSWRSTCSSSVLSSSCEAEIYEGAMAAQDLRWLTYRLTNLGEQPRLPPVLYVDNKAMIALCKEHRLEHRTKHIALRYFLARDLQQRGQLRLAYMASRANTADIFTKALPPGGETGTGAASGVSVVQSRKKQRDAPESSVKVCEASAEAGSVAGDARAPKAAANSLAPGAAADSLDILPHPEDDYSSGVAARCTPPLDESVEPSCSYPELVGCLMYLMTCTRPELAISGIGLVLGGRGSVVLAGDCDASWADDQATQRSSQGYTFCLGSGSVSWRSTHSSSVLGSSCEAEIYARAMAAQELRWLTYLLTELGERPRSPPLLYINNKAMLALCLE
ncbi:unnamed protein product [Closterium sp. NIES-54]